MCANCITSHWMFRSIFMLTLDIIYSTISIKLCDQRINLQNYWAHWPPSNIHLQNRNPACIFFFFFFFLLDCLYYINNIIMYLVGTIAPAQSWKPWEICWIIFDFFLFFLLLNQGKKWLLRDVKFKISWVKNKKILLSIGNEKRYSIIHSSTGNKRENSGAVKKIFFKTKILE